MTLRTRARAAAAVSDVHAGPEASTEAGTELVYSSGKPQRQHTGGNTRTDEGGDVVVGRLQDGGSAAVV